MLYITITCRVILCHVIGQFSFNVFDHPMQRGFQNRFSTQYRCYSVSMLAGPNDRSDVEKGGKSETPHLVYVKSVMHCALIEHIELIKLLSSLTHSYNATISSRSTQ